VGSRSSGSRISPMWLLLCVTLAVTLTGVLMLGRAEPR
jgi:hypothetical protein